MTSNPSKRPFNPIPTLLGVVCMVVLGGIIWSHSQKQKGVKEQQEDTLVKEDSRPKISPAVFAESRSPLEEDIVEPQQSWQEEVVDEIEPPSDSHLRRLGRLFQEATDEEQRRSNFERMLSQLTAENGREMRRYVADLDPQSYEYQEFHYRWGQVGGKEAVLHGATTKKPDMRTTLAGWASADPEGAMKWFKSLPEHDRKSYSNQADMMSGLVHGLTDHSQEQGLQFVFELEKAKHPMMGRMMSVVTGRMIDAQGVEMIAGWTDTLPKGSLRAIARARVVWDLGKQDLGAAASWVEGFAHEGDAGLGVEAMAKVWARQDILGSVTWLESLEHGPAKRKGISAAYGYWGALEPDSAAQYLNEQAPNIDRDFAINGFISGMVHKDPETALVWAEEIKTQGLRESAMVRAGERFFRMDPQAATDWMEGVSLSKSSMNRLKKIQQYHLRQQASTANE